jgi:hypothetical protein
MTQADKGKTIVMMYTQEYDQYIDTYINNSHFAQLPTDPTNTYQRFIKDSINSCKMLSLINKNKNITTVTQILQHYAPS